MSHFYAIIDFTKVTHFSYMPNTRMRETSRCNPLIGKKRKEKFAGRKNMPIFASAIAEHLVR